MPNSGSNSGGLSSGSNGLSRVSSDPPSASTGPLGLATRKPSLTPVSSKEEKKPKLPITTSLTQGGFVSPSDGKDTPEARKKQALSMGPVLNIDRGNHESYGMEESLFSALKDIFENIMAHSSRTGVVSPNRFLEILRRDNDMFSGQQHQDAHEFLNYVLNQVIENVEDYQKKHGSRNGIGQSPTPPKSSGTLTPVDGSSAASTASLTSTTSTGWIHELFEGLLTSETKCLTCENVSRRDEQFLDLSIDLEKNSSVTSCLRNFSASEMLCERNKFHCDSCGGLQEAEKRMKIKRLPKVLALHLKRFKFMESVGRFEKLHYRVLYPYHLRLFNTTDDAEDPDRLYELYAVVVHIGGGPFHGHYVAIVKTEDKGWLLFDDELVEPVDKSFVRNFFGERPGMACAYVLFYQETTLEAVQREMWADDQAAGEATRAAAAATADATKADATKSKGMNGHARSSIVEHVPQSNASIPLSPLLPKEDQPSSSSPPLPLPTPAADGKPPASAPNGSTTKPKKEKKEKVKSENGNGHHHHHHAMSRFKPTSKSFRNPPRWFGGKDKERAVAADDNPVTSSTTPAHPTPVAVTPEVPTAAAAAAINGTTTTTPTTSHTSTIAEEKEGEDQHHEHDTREHDHDHDISRKERKSKHLSTLFGLRKKPSSVAFAAGS